MNEDSLVDLQGWVQPLLAKLQPQELRRLSIVIGRKLAAAQRARIAQQQNPDGTPFAPRKAQASSARARRGGIRRQAMFRKIRLARYLTTTATPEGVAVGFTAQISRIARVHQFGLRDRPSRGAKDVQYPRRELLGFTAADREMVLDALLTRIAGGTAP